MNPAVFSIVTTANPDAAVMKAFYLNVASVTGIGCCADIVIVDDLRCLQLEDFPASTKNYSAISTRHYRSGQAAALELGITASAGEYILILDPDMSDQLSLLPEIFALIADGADVVVVNRRFLGRSHFRRVASVVAGALLSIMIGRRVIDIGSPMVMFNRQVFERFKSHGVPLKTFRVFLAVFNEAYSVRFVDASIKDSSNRISTYSPLDLLKLFSYLGFWIVIFRMKKIKSL